MLGFMRMIGIAIGLYAFHFLSGPLEFFKIPKRRIFSVVVRVIFGIIIGILSMNIWGTPAVVIYHILGISLVMDFFYIIVKLVRKKYFHSRLKHSRSLKEFASIGRALYRLRVIPILITALMIGYGFFNIHHVMETDYTVYTSKNIRSEGYRVALISDLHFDTIMKEEQLIEECKKINNQNPDIIVLCGDIVEEGTSYEALQRGMEILGSMQSNYGIFYVYGNHDQAPYTNSPNFSPQQLEAALVANNIHILKDTIYEVNEDLVLIGRDNAAWGETNPRKTSNELLTGVDKNKYLLLLDHQPVGIEENRMAGIDLQLSGHTHAGQIWPVGVVTELSGNLNYGKKTYDSSYGKFTVIVSSGIAGWGYPIRTGGHSEYVIIDIKK